MRKYTIKIDKEPDNQFTIEGNRIFNTDAGCQILCISSVDTSTFLILDSEPVIAIDEGNDLWFFPVDCNNIEPKLELFNKKIIRTPVKKN